MLDQIVAALERHPRVSDWTVCRRRSRSVQLYLIGDDVECLRHVATEEFDVEVVNDHPFPQGAQGGEGASSLDEPGAQAQASPVPHGEGQPRSARGAASLTLVSADRARLAQRLDDAVVMAQLVHNPPYRLAEPAGYPDVALSDPLLATIDGAARAAQAFAGDLRGYIAREPDVRLSAAELFLTRTERELRTSRGIRTESVSTHVQTELALLASGRDAEEAEHFRQVEARRLTDLRLAEAVSEAATFARDTLHARAPQTRIGPVVISGDALGPLFDPFVFQASASAAYMKLSSLSVGQSVFGEHAVRGDRLTLRTNALRPFSVRSHRFDADGVPGQDALLVAAGALSAHHATQRYAEYLGVPATGAPGTTEVTPGDAPLAALLVGNVPVYEVVAFSAPDVDAITGDFGSEIRLGYELTPQGRRPIKGGSVSGNVFEAFANARFSREVLDRGGYCGPQAVRFASLRVAGDA